MPSHQAMDSTVVCVCAVQRAYVTEDQSTCYNIQPVTAASSQLYTISVFTVDMTPQHTALYDISTHLNMSLFRYYQHKRPS